MMTRPWKRGMLAAAVVAALSAATNLAAAVVTVTSATSDTGFTVSSEDLIHGVAPTAVSGTSDPFSTGTDTTAVVLTDGSFGPANDGANGGPNTTIVGNGAQIDYTLTGSALGYDITGIDTYSGWSNNGRVNQDYTVSYATVSAPNTFIPITPVSEGGAATTPSGLKVSISETSGILASDVIKIRFDFPAVQNNAVGYRELDVFGTPVPEPVGATAAALFAGAALVVRRSRRL